MKHDAYLWEHKNTGYYYVVYYDGPLGSRKRRESLKTKDLSTAQDRLYLWKRQRAKEEALGVRQVGVLLEDAQKEFLRHFGNRNKPVSVRRYRNALDNVLEFVGQDLPIGSLQTKDLQDYQLARVVNADARTVDYELDVIRQLLNWCKKRAWIRENVADSDHVDRLIGKNHQKTEKRIFTDEELKVLLAPQDGSYWQLSYIFNTLYFSGLRIGELGFLIIKDVDLPGLEIRIKEKTIRVPVLKPRGKTEIREVHWTPKSHEKRTVPIEPRLEPILREFHTRRTDNIFGLYFTSKQGAQVTDHISRQIKLLTKKEDVSVHTFRHTHISHALNRWGRYPSIVQQWVGHKHLRTTQQYIHTSTEDLHREARKTGS